MPTCQNCNCQWSWIVALKLGFKGNKLCSNCSKRQYVSVKSRTRPYFSYMIPVIILLASGSLFDLDQVFYILSGVLLVLLSLIILPFTIKLSNEQEPLS
ncbi:TIGR04104 family putative zinc finger protein [Planococcus soli]